MTPRSIRRHESRQPGLTLVETLAATILLTMIAVAATGLLREMAYPRTGGVQQEHSAQSAWAALLAEELARDPVAFGLGELADLDTAPRELSVPPAPAAPGGSTARSARPTA